jgi:hypothetical protein
LANVLVNGICLPRTEIELGATCPTLFTTRDQSQLFFPCTEHEPVRVRFHWVCPGSERNHTCKATSFDVLLSLDGKVAFTANGFGLPHDANQVPVPAAPCDRGYLIGWVINRSGQPIKYDGLIGRAIIRDSNTAAATYRGITIQAEATTTPGSIIDLVNDPIGLKPPGLPFLGEPGLPGVGTPHPYRLVTGQVTGDVTFDEPTPAAGFGFGVTSSLILLTLDVRSNAPNFPTFVPLRFWNASEKLLSTFVSFVCWGEFRLSVDIDPKLTQAFMRTRTGIVQSGEAVKSPIAGIRDFITEVSGRVTLLGLVQTSEIPVDGVAARSSFVELYNNGINFPPTIFFQ